MKKRSNLKNRRSEKVALTVSAAALMLGVSHSATVGFNFQNDYCGYTASYVNFVQATAFGIPTNSWENLTAMGTGYGCPALSFSLSEQIDTTTSTSGLHPLPNGSLTVSWSAPTANWSNFGGYGGTPPNYRFGGNVPPHGAGDVYAGFLRDGQEFGPIDASKTPSPCGDNTAGSPGYSVDIVGLKSVFTNNPFVIELVGASDSMQVLTNAFIIDATLSTTQSVIYPSTPKVVDAGGTCGHWVRGNGGGLSTVSGALNTDHVKIIGNQAQHGSGGTNGFDNASCIAGFIVTDKPVLTMSPNPVVVAPGDTVTWSGYAAGVPPLAYQWRHNGVPVPGATSTSFSITNITSANQGYYDLAVTNLYGSTVSAPVPVDQISAAAVTNLVADSNPSGPEHDGLDLGATWLASSGTHSGVMSFNGTNQNHIVVPGQTSFDAPSGTLSFWMRSPGLINPTGKSAAIFDRQASGGGFIVTQTSAGGLEVTVTTAINDIPSASTTISDTNWHQVAVVFNVTNSEQIQIYIDGALDSSGGNAGDWSWPVGQELELGLSHDTSLQPYNGLLDDVRFYNRALTGSEITSVFNTGALVDNNALIMRLNFDAAPTKGLNLAWRATDVTLQSATSILGPFTDTPSKAAPYPTSFGKAAQFYRYRGHSPTNTVSNPFLM
jgi:hypothetical protein